MNIGAEKMINNYPEKSSSSTVMVSENKTKKRTILSAFKSSEFPIIVEDEESFHDVPTAIKKKRVSVSKTERVESKKESSVIENSSIDGSDGEGSNQEEDSVSVSTSGTLPASLSTRKAVSKVFKYIGEEYL